MKKATNLTEGGSENRRLCRQLQQEARWAWVLKVEETSGAIHNTMGPDDRMDRHQGADMASEDRQVEDMQAKTGGHEDGIRAPILRYRRSHLPATMLASGL